MRGLVPSLPATPAHQRGLVIACLIELLISAFHFFVLWALETMPALSAGRDCRLRVFRDARPDGHSRVDS